MADQVERGPAVSGGCGEGFGAAGEHGVDLAAGAGDDGEQYLALHGQVVEAVAVGQVQRGVEFGAGPGLVVVVEQRGAPGQAGECLQRRFGRQRVDVGCRVDVGAADVGCRVDVGRDGRCGFLGRGGELLDGRVQDGQVGGVVAGPALPHVPQVGPGGGQVAGLEPGQGGGQGQPGVGGGGVGAEVGQRAA